MPVLGMVKANRAIWNHDDLAQYPVLGDLAGFGVVAVEAALMQDSITLPGADSRCLVLGLADQYARHNQL